MCIDTFITEISNSNLRLQKYVYILLKCVVKQACFTRFSGIVHPICCMVNAVVGNKGVNCWGHKKA